MELDAVTMGVIGIVAGILILSGWVPQIVRGYKTKRLNDVSPYLMILIFAGAVLCLIYGKHIRSTNIINELGFWCDTGKTKTNWTWTILLELR